MNTRRLSMLVGVSVAAVCTPLGLLQVCGRGSPQATAMATEQPSPALRATPDAEMVTSISRRHIPPGDPVITVDAPADARRVTAYFPFGLTKDLVYDTSQKTWRGRFLVPEGIEDGDYTISLGIELQDGKRRLAHERYHLDSTQPEFNAQFENDVVWPGELVTLSVDSVEPAADAYAHCPLLGWHRVNLLPRDGRTAVHHRLNRMLPEDTPPGEYLVMVVIRDRAGNRMERFLMLSVVAMPAV